MTRGIMAMGQFSKMLNYPFNWCSVVSLSLSAPSVVSLFKSFHSVFGPRTLPSRKPFIFPISQRTFYTSLLYERLFKAWLLWWWAPPCLWIIISTLRWDSNFLTIGRTTSSAKVITSMHETNWKLHILRETKFSEVDVSHWFEGTAHVARRVRFYPPKCHSRLAGNETRNY